jgi:hypothetical protein
MFLLRRDADGLAKTYLAVVYTDGKATTRIRANPGFIHYARTLPPVIGERQEHSLIALKTFWKNFLHSYPSSLITHL